MKPSSVATVLTAAMKAGQPVLVKSAPGLGKTSVAEQTAEALGYDLAISHPVVSDPTDFKGLPFAVDGHAKFLPYGDLERMVNADRPLVVLLDDLGQAPPLVQAACMHLLLARQIGEAKVSDHVRFVACTNRKQDRAGVTSILEPVKSRFVTIIEMDADVNDWVKWAVAHDIQAEVIAFIRWKPQFITKYEASADIVNSPSPRTVAHAAEIIRWGLPVFEEYEALKGAVGEAMAGELKAFLETFRHLPSIESIMLDPLNAKLPEPNRPDVALSLATTLGMRATPDNIGKICKYLGRWDVESGLADYAVVTIRDAITRDANITMSRDFAGWAAKNAKFTGI